MKRKIIEQLLEWEKSAHRMPLILEGARQVGKTYTALTFGRDYYANTAYFNMEDSAETKQIFERDFDIERMIRELSAKFGGSIMPEKTLIIFDEIQACERALTSLKYFCENAPEYHIIAAGSLLGVALNREKYSFPVGKVDRLTLRPMDFEEFLWATENPKMADAIRQAYDEVKPFSLHEAALDLYRRYLVAGGMPQAVSTYIETGDFNFVLAAQKTLGDSYIADMAKYAAPQETVRIMAAWGSIPAQFAKENHKFQYRVIKSGARAHEYEIPIAWLNSSGIVNKCVRVSEGKAPISAYADNNSFKIYMADTGVLCSKLGVNADAMLTESRLSDAFRGAMAENYVMQALVACDITPYYWTQRQNAELDFVYQNQGGDIIPIEVKSGIRVRSKSLNIFMDQYECPYAIRVSEKNFGFEDEIKSIPLYALFCMH